jgi:hypothetical protein
MRRDSVDYTEIVAARGPVNPSGNFVAASVDYQLETLGIKIIFPSGRAQRRNMPDETNTWEERAKNEVSMKTDRMTMFRMCHLHCEVRIQSFHLDD